MKLNRILMILTSIVLVACFDDPGTDIVWGNEAYLEIDRAGQPNPTVNVANERLDDGTVYPFDIKVNLMGKQRSGDVVANFTIDPASTAIEGIHYNKITTGSSVTIPGGESSTFIEFEQIADSFVPDDPSTAADDILLIVTLTDDSDLPLSKYVKVTYKLTVTCPSLLAVGMYDGHTDWIDYYGDPGSNDYTANITAATGTARFNLPDLSGGMEPIIWGNPAVPIVFADVCGTITLISHSYFYGYFIDSGSTFNEITGVIIINWHNAFDESGVNTLTPQ